MAAHAAGIALCAIALRQDRDARRRKRVVDAHLACVGVDELLPVRLHQLLLAALAAGIVAEEILYHSPATLSPVLAGASDDGRREIPDAAAVPGADVHQRQGPCVARVLFLYQQERAFRGPHHGRAFDPRVLRVGRGFRQGLGEPRPQREPDVFTSSSRFPHTYVWVGRRLHGDGGANLLLANSEALHLFSSLFFIVRLL